MGGVVKRDHTCPISSGESKTGEIMILLTILLLTENGVSPRDAQRDAHLNKVASQARSTLPLFLVKDQKNFYLMKTGEQ
jgi:hypothetical protein